MNTLFHAYAKEFGRTPNFYAGYYEKLDTWQSELTEWISSQGCPCQAYCQRTTTNGAPIMERYLPVGIEVESSWSTYLWMKWS